MVQVGLLPLLLHAPSHPEKVIVGDVVACMVTVVVVGYVMPQPSEQELPAGVNETEPGGGGIPCESMVDGTCWMPMPS